jgi:hypothetical protein
MERWLRICRTELLDRTLILNQARVPPCRLTCMDAIIGTYNVATQPRPQWTYQRVPLRSLTCNDDFSSGTGSGEPDSHGVTELFTVLEIGERVSGVRAWSRMLT